MTAIGFPFSNVYQRHVSPSISAGSRRPPARRFPALIAYVCGYLAEGGDVFTLPQCGQVASAQSSPSRPSMMLTCTTPTTAPHSLQRSSTSLSSTAAMMRPEQSTPLIPCGTTGIKPVSSSLNS